MKNLNIAKSLGLCVAVLPLFQPEAQAMTYSNDNLDAMLCFRKLGAPNPFDLEVDIGSITNYTGLAVGVVTNLTPHFFTTDQLADAMGVTNFDNVEFSVTAGAFDIGFQNSYPVPFHTAYITFGRTDSGTPTTAFNRGSTAALGNMDTQIDAIGASASTYSGPKPVSSRNTATAVEIPPGSTGNSCEVPLGPNGNLKGQSTVVVENRAPSPFASAIVSDLYIDVPNGQADPFNANATGGKVSYLGFFTFSPDGTVTFTRQNQQTTVKNPPPPPTLGISSPSANTFAVSFVSSNSATYTLYYTNIAGLGQPVSTWVTVPTNITGDGTTKTFIDVTTDSNRVYRVKGQ